MLSERQNTWMSLADIGMTLGVNVPKDPAVILVKVIHLGWMKSLGDRRDLARRTAENHERSMRTGVVQ